MALDFTTSFIKLNNQYTIVGTAEDVEPTIVPKKGELYFLPETSGERTCKIGDGETQFQHLPVIGVSKLSLEDTSETKDVVNLAYNGKYKLNVGNKNIVFKMPDVEEFTDTFQKADYITGLKIATGNNTPDLYVPTGTSATTVALGDHSHSYAGSDTAGGPATRVKSTVIKSSDEVLTLIRKGAGAAAFDIAAADGITPITGGPTLGHYAQGIVTSDVTGEGTLWAVNSSGTPYCGFIANNDGKTTWSSLKRILTVGDEQGTAVTLNGSSKAGATASFYAPTAGGTPGYILKSNGSGAPTWLQTLPIANGGTGTNTAEGLTSKVLTGGFNTAAIKATTVDITITLSAVPTSTYEQFSSKTIDGIILGTTSSPTEPSGTLMFNGVKISNKLNGSSKITVKVKKRAGQHYDPSTTVSIGILLIPLS